MLNKNTIANSFQMPTSDLKRAIEFAEKYHRGQFRKSLNREPMLQHCLNVGDILIKTGSSNSAVVAGILHDTIEDTVVNKKNLVNTFGGKVANLVDCVTESATTKDWMERCDLYIKKLKKSPVDAMCISAADKIDNMKSISENLMNGFNIFKNMQGTPEMQLKKFTGVYKVIEGKIPKQLQQLYKKNLDNLTKVLKNKALL